MLDLDTWREILETIGRNKLRAALTAFSVAWGIFMLVVLLGSGEGLANGAAHQFRDDAVNSIWMWSGDTSLPHRGTKPGRRVQLTDEDHDGVVRGIAGAEHVTSRYGLGGVIEVTRGGKTGSFDVRCVHPAHQHVERTVVTAGRYLNPLDLAEHRKVAVIGLAVRDALFGAESPLGEEIAINGVAFKVVGVFDDAGGIGELQKIYVPITTARRAFGGANRVNLIVLTTGTAPLARTRSIVAEIRRQVARRHDFAPEDQRALWVRDNNEMYQRIQSMLAAIRAFVWFVGLGTMLAGIVGVSNIMMIVVRERTREIGIRKSIGATPGSIVALVLQEALLVTSVAGYVGLVLGVAALELMTRFLPDSGFFREPRVDLATALQALLLLVAAGLAAGFFPARRAAAVHPVAALRDE